MNHDPSNDACPRNADPRNESCACGVNWQHPLTFPEFSDKQLAALILARLLDKRKVGTMVAELDRRINRS